MNKEFIICLDSDGSVMDTMNVKHFNYFGPCAASTFQIKNEKIFLDEWNRLNLFSISRGINRFQGLLKILDFAKENGESIENLDNFKHWVENTRSLSNDSLTEFRRDFSDDLILSRALSWSNDVNKKIKEELSGQDKPFENMNHFLKKAATLADIAVVSSANKGAIESEWSRHKLMTNIKVMYGQEDGSKASVLNKILNSGYDKENILMVGDAIGDKKAASKNGISFYPILFGKETESWNFLLEEALPKLISHKYSDIQPTLINNFLSNFQ